MSDTCAISRRVCVAVCFGRASVFVACVRYADWRCSSSHPSLWATSAATGWSSTAGGAALNPLSPCSSIFIRTWKEWHLQCESFTSTLKPHCLFLMNVFYFALAFFHRLLGDKDRGRVHTVDRVELLDHLGLRHTAVRHQCNTADTSQLCNPAVILPDQLGPAVQSPLHPFRLSSQQHNCCCWRRLSSAASRVISQREIMSSSLIVSCPVGWYATLNIFYSSILKSIHSDDV